MGLLKNKVIVPRTFPTCTLLSCVLATVSRYNVSSVNGGLCYELFCSSRQSRLSNFYGSFSGTCSALLILVYDTDRAANISYGINSLRVNLESKLRDLLLYLPDHFLCKYRTISSMLDYPKGILPLLRASVSIETTSGRVLVSEVAA